nr:hypothetical protein B11C_110200 [Bartonella sp. 1-1C]
MHKGHKRISKMNRNSFKKKEHCVEFYRREFENPLLKAYDTVFNFKKYRDQYIKKKNWHISI